MITVIIRMTVRPEKHREFVQTIHGMIDLSRKQSGRVSREFYQRTGNEHAFVLLEEWETAEDLDDHLRSDWFHILLGTRNLLEEEPEMKFSSFSHATLMRAATPGSFDL